MDIPHTQAQIETLELQIVRQVAELAIHKVYWLLLEEITHGRRSGCSGRICDKRL